MDSTEIDRLAKRNTITKNLFSGVYAWDLLPTPEKLCGFYIVNLDKSTSTGTHWVCLEIWPHRRNIYFDSYGQRPQNDTLKKILGENCVSNLKRVQHSLSTTCAQWCLYFIYRRCLGWPLRTILKPFKRQTKKNETIINDHVVNFEVERLFRTNEKVIHRGFLMQQMQRQLAKKCAERKVKRLLSTSHNLPKDDGSRRARRNQRRRRRNKRSLH